MSDQSNPEIDYHDFLIAGEAGGGKSGLIPARCDTEMTDIPLLDVGGYLACGCHGSQPEHTCNPLD